MPGIAECSSWAPLSPDLGLRLIRHEAGKHRALWRGPPGLSPVEVYCYLKARFGPPNGVMMIFRSDSTDNLVHWQYAVESDGDALEINGTNAGLDLVFYSDKPIVPGTSDALFAGIAKEMAARRGQIAKERRTLEVWSRFINPYRRFDEAIANLLIQLQATEPLTAPIRPGVERPNRKEDLDAYFTALISWQDRVQRASTACLALRMIAPVVGEAFVNFVFFALAAKDVREDPRVRDDFLRRPIDVRIRSLHRNCDGFANPVDASSQEFKDFHTVMNGRNDLLHGNIDPRRLTFEDVSFDARTIPLFHTTEPRLHVETEARLTHVRPEEARRDVNAVYAFILLVLSALKPRVRSQVGMMLSQWDLGIRADTGRLGVLFSGAAESFVSL